MRCSVFLLIVVSSIGGVSAECNLSDRQITSRMKKFQKKCLNRGFESTLPECVTKGGPEDLSKHNEEKCEEAEENLAACDADCSPATLCTQSDKQIGKLWDKFDKKCLKKGYATTLPGCQPEEDSEHKSNDRHCGKLEQELLTVASTVKSKNQRRKNQRRKNQRR